MVRVGGLAGLVAKTAARGLGDEVDVLTQRVYQGSSARQRIGKCTSEDLSSLFYTSS